MLKKVCALVFIFILSSNSNAAENYASGTITNLTVGTAGIMIKLSGSLPNNCEGTPYGWILIKQEYSAMTSVILASWISQKTKGVFYTSGLLNGTGNCILTQFDPTE